MKKLHVFFDEECAMCQRCRQWLERQPAFVELDFLPLQSPEVPRRFPGIDQWNLRKELVVVSDQGDLYQGSSAWIMCLYALRDYREWAQRLAHPALLPVARRICEMVSENRLNISSWFLKARPETIRDLLPAPDCEGSCHV